MSVYVHRMYYAMYNNNKFLRQRDIINYDCMAIFILFICIDSSPHSLRTISRDDRPASDALRNKEHKIKSFARHYIFSPLICRDIYTLVMSENAWYFDFKVYYTVKNDTGTIRVLFSVTLYNHEIFLIDSYDFAVFSCRLLYGCYSNNVNTHSNVIYLITSNCNSR